MWSRFQTCFFSTPKIGEDEPILTSIFFQMGWFNHQLGLYVRFERDSPDPFLSSFRMGLGFPKHPIRFSRGLDPPGEWGFPGQVTTWGPQWSDLLGSFRPKLHELSRGFTYIRKRKQTHRINTFTSCNIIRSQHNSIPYITLILGKLILWLKSVSTNDVCWRSLGFQHGSAYFSVDRSTK